MQHGHSTRQSTYNKVMGDYKPCVVSGLPEIFVVLNPEDRWGDEVTLGRRAQSSIGRLETT